MLLESDILKKRNRDKIMFQLDKLRRINDYVVKKIYRR